MSPPWLVRSPSSWSALDLSERRSFPEATGSFPGRSHASEPTQFSSWSAWRRWVGKNNASEEGNSWKLKP